MVSLEPFQIESNELMLEDLDRLWRPFMKLSRFVGVFPFVSKFQDTSGTWWKNLWNICSIFALCGFFSRMGLTTASRVVGGGTITLVDVDILSVIVFPLHLVASTVGFVYFLNFTTYLKDMFNLWSSLTIERDTATVISTRVKRRVKWALVLSAFALIQAFYVLCSEIHRMCTYGLPVTHVLNELPLVWCIIVHVIQTGLFCTLCCAISCLLDGVCQDAEVKLNKGTLSTSLQSLKDSYTIVTDFIQVSNDLFGIYVGFLVISSLLQACVDTYTIIVYTIIHKNIFGIVVWVMYNLLTTVIVCLSAAEIHDKARRPYKIVQKIDFSKCSSFQQNEAILLLDCIKNCDANISMFRIIPITMQTLPTIISVYFSYMFLLFQLPSGPTNA